MMGEDANLSKIKLPEYTKDRRLVERLGENQVYALEKKYLRRDNIGQLVETLPEAIYRMAFTMAEVERSYGKSQQEIDNFTELFYKMIADGNFSPAGRIWTNAGTDIKGLFNCYVLPVPDSLDGIFDSVRKAAIIHKNGGGTGYNFSELRPRGTYVRKSKGIASGVVSFIGQFDKETEVINSGNRRGANMGIVNVNHPDILDFIYAKAQRGEISNFNVSVGSFDDFMLAVENREHYKLEFPKGKPFHWEELRDIIRNVEENKLGGSGVGEKPRPASLKFDTSEITPGKTRVIDLQSKQVAGRISEDGTVELFAPYVMDLISELAWKTADPGMIFLDAINRRNPLPRIGPIMATNPCGEQPLHPYDACNLGSVILANMIHEKDGKKEVDYDRISDTVKRATRFMDNVNDANQGPIIEIEETVKKNRRIGMGVMGWADMIAILNIPYDSEEAVNLAEKVMSFITTEAKKTSVELAKEKGVFPAFEGSRYDNGKLEDRVRNVERTTIAPTGTISMVYEVGSGIEPFFAITYRKNIRGGDTLTYAVKPFVEECKKRELDLKRLLPLIEENHGSVQGIDAIPKDMQEFFKTSHDLNSEAHLKMQAAFQRGTDNAVSKTINMRNDTTISQIRAVYIEAWKADLKGITVYRDGCKEIQVLEAGHGKKAQREKITPEKLPEIMPAIRIRQQTPFGNMHVNIVYDPRTGDIKENFAQLGKGGDIITSELEALSRLSSLIYRMGGDVGLVIEQLGGIGSKLSMPSKDGQISSLPAAYALAIRKFVELKEQGLLETITNRETDLSDVAQKVSEGMRNKGKEQLVPQKEKQGEVYGVRCPECPSGRLIYEEGCEKCHTCGFSTC